MDLLKRFEEEMVKEQKEYMRGWAYSGISSDKWDGLDRGSEAMAERAVELLERFLAEMRVEQEGEGKEEET